MGPAEMRAGRRHGERRIGDAAGNHDLRAGIQRIDQGLRSDVGVGADDPRALEGAAELLLKQRPVLGTGEVVPGDDRDARRLQAEFPGESSNVPGGAFRVGCAEVADDADAVLQAGGEDGSQQRLELRLVAAVWIAAPSHWARARVRSASVSNTRNDGPPRSISDRTTGSAASTRSPEKPAAQPIRSGVEAMSPLAVCRLPAARGHG
jgi:hypothetical protein